MSETANESSVFLCQRKKVRKKRKEKKMKKEETLEVLKEFMVHKNWNANILVNESKRLTSINECVY